MARLPVSRPRRARLVRGWRPRSAWRSRNEFSPRDLANALVDHRTWVIASDGDLMEGISHEALGLAGHLGLSKLTVLYDQNHISIDGDTALAVSDDVMKRVAAHNWAVRHVDGHDPEQVAAAFARREAIPDR